MKKHIIAAALAAASLTPVMAQAAPTPSAPAKDTAAAPAVSPTVGAKVYDEQGGEVGTVETVDAANAVVNTGAKKATLPLVAFGKNDKGLLIKMTKPQLEAAVAAAEAKTASATNSALVANAAVKTSDGVAIGTVQKVEGDNVTVALTGGSPVTLTKQYFTTQADGSLALTMKDAELKAAVAAATQGAASAQPGADANASTNAQNAASGPATEAPADAASETTEPAGQ